MSNPTGPAQTFMGRVAATSNGSDRSPPPIVLVVGPTAAGKTGLALALARALGGEVVGADAFQVYRGMDIGTNKPTPAELASTPHHLIDVVDPDRPFDAQSFVELADQAILDISARSHVAIVAGGTGLYTRALVRGLAALPAANPEVRARLNAEAERRGLAQLHARLGQLDPVSAATIHPTDSVRIVRALEVSELAGRPMSELHAEHSQQPDRYRVLWIGIDQGRDQIRQRIEARTKIMFQSGFVAEVRGLHEAGYGPDLPAMRALGYRHVSRLIADELSEPDALELTVRDTARYARRQRTWFRSQAAVHWVEAGSAELVGQVRDFLAAPSQ